MSDWAFWTSVVRLNIVTPCSVPYTPVEVRTAIAYMERSSRTRDKHFDPLGPDAQASHSCTTPPCVLESLKVQMKCLGLSLV